MKKTKPPVWVVRSLTSGKLYGPFSDAAVAAKWGVSNIRRDSAWAVQRVNRK